MPRLSVLGILASFAALTVATTVSAQETGGITLSPEVLKADNAQGQVLDHVLARVQQLQQLRLLNLTNGGVVSSNLANPAGALSQGPLVAPDAALSLANSLRRRNTRISSDPVFQQFVDNSQSLTVNAPNSSVNIGDNNIVKQQVTTSTAVSPTGNATASAGVGHASHHHGNGGNGKDATKSSQTAVSDATSIGGTAQAVAINSEVSPRSN
jgi:hypothetical protein